MITINKPEGNIVNLWGKQQINQRSTYRLMRYVLQLDYEEKRLLHNVVTGQLIVLEEEEKCLIDRLPSIYNEKMRELVIDHFLVSESYDEHQQVVNLRRILSKLQDAYAKPGISKYTILPTTACNARCYYCYEHGIKPVTMTEQTANAVVDFIAKNSQGKSVRIRWFGGEPTLGIHRINQICKGLTKKGVQFSSNIISNGYLFDEDLIKQAKQCWKLDSVKLSMDGTKQSFNRIKSFVNVQDDPYERVLRNIGLFLNQDIRVSVFMNIDKCNYQEFYELVAELKARFKDNPLLRVRPHQIIDSYIEDNDCSDRTKEAWYQHQLFCLNEYSREKGFLNNNSKLPSLEYRWCEAAANDSITILPEGNLVSCPEQLSESQYLGDINQGIVNKCLVCSWKQFSDYPRCHNCVLYPECIRVVNCASGDSCFLKVDKISQFKKGMVNCLEKEFSIKSYY